MNKVKLVLKPGHPRGSMCVLLQDGSDVDVTVEGVVVDENQVTDDIRMLDMWIEIQEPDSDRDGDSDSNEAKRAELEAMTMKDLRELAKSVSVDARDTKKSELINEILAALK